MPNPGISKRIKLLHGAQVFFISKKEKKNVVRFPFLPTKLLGMNLNTCKE